MDFKTNEGSVERVTRGLLGVVFLAVGLSRRADGKSGIIPLGLAGLLGVTAATGFCPAWAVLGIDTTETCSVKNVKKMVA
jgi:hypothetical protein